jgi:hypothetical protein
MNKIFKATLFCLLTITQLTLAVNETSSNDPALVQSIKNSLLNVIAKGTDIVNEPHNGPITAQATASLFGNQLFINRFLRPESPEREILENINKLLLNSVIATNLQKSPLGRHSTQFFK